MDTPEMIVWVVVKQGKVGEHGYDEIDVQERSYPTKEFAQKRADHLMSSENARTTVWPVKVAYDPPQAAPVTPLTPIWWPPSGVFTPDGGQPLYAYDAPRRVFDMPSSAWAQTTLGEKPSAELNLAAIPPEFEVSPEGQLSLFPRELPEPARS